MFAATLWLCSACLGSCWSASCDDVVNSWLFGQTWNKSVNNWNRRTKRNNIPPSHSIPGVGKTAVVTSYLKELGHKCARSIWGKAVELNSSPARILVPLCRYISLNCYCLALIWVFCVLFPSRETPGWHRKFAHIDVGAFVRDWLRQTQGVKCRKPCQWAGLLNIATRLAENLDIILGSSQEMQFVVSNLGILSRADLHRKLVMGVSSTQW